MSSEFENIREIGGATKLYVAIQGVHNDPATTDFLPLGAVSSLSWSEDGNALEANDSLNGSGYTEFQRGKSTLGLSVSGNYVRNPSAFPNYLFIDALRKHFRNTVNKELNQDPIICVKVVEPTITTTGYFMIQSIGVEKPNAELSTFSMELALATSPLYPLTTTDTPQA